MKKLLIATVLTAAFGISGVTFASTNDVQNNNEPIKMNLLVERNHDDANNFQDKKCDMLLENQNTRKPPISVMVLRAAGREPILKLEIALIGLDSKK